MRRLLLLPLAVCVFATTSNAGPNAGGVLAIDALPESVEYSAFDNPLCETYGGDLPATCLDLDTNLPSGVLDPFLWQVVAIFPDLSSPRLTGTIFGLEYDPNNVFIVDYGGCGTFELAMSNWPDTNTGVAVTWELAETAHVTGVYMFAGYAYYSGDTTLDLIPHPNGGALFADDDVPANLDEVVDLGVLGFGNDPGYSPCPGQAAGACCEDDGDCRLLSEEDCEQRRDTWLGEGTSCDPNPCPASGACCLPDGSCVEVNETECEDAGGAFFESEPCSEELCEPVPVIETSWGQIKRSHR